MEKIQLNEQLTTEEQSHEFCEYTAKLALGIKSAFMMLAKNLYLIESKKMYKPTYDYMYQYCDEIGIDTATCSKLTTIYEKFCEQYGIPLDEIIDLEYTKLYLIKKVSGNKELAEYWIEEIKSGLTIRDLKKRIQEVTSGVDQMKCEHRETYLVRCCKECGEKWEEYPNTK